MKKSNTHMPIVFYVGLLLVCLTFFSIHMSSGLYARYVTQASGSDSARVATFDLAMTGDLEQNLSLTLDPGETQTYTFTFTNSGETTLAYRFELINTTGNLPLTFSSDQGTLGMGQTVQGVTCKITWPKETETGNPTDPEYAGMVDVVTVRVIVEQVD